MLFCGSPALEWVFCPVTTVTNYSMMSDDVDDPRSLISLSLPRILLLGSAPKATVHDATSLSLVQYPVTVPLVRYEKEPSTHHHHHPVPIESTLHANRQQ
ncbi:uncharacterized protein BO66DRAFT_393493 [Aspergillus aculeatinus CBS 121060]|uniref:Uncharacterized protein n=1 Tax=Aspergillus aculeatinus CBS 121060 TaxID=1448322 RepID=A0ACD1H2L3_9EURO|nr:hypothetical protein BO66DRAFT_393493 [Aspergillus aculeatinus CBS 121060]RAH67765.1 hypothetical protein BO66DRAFT_393493 [Aspergillus aculeatinus CBS 121060]